MAVLLNQKNHSLMPKSKSAKMQKCKTDVIKLEALAPLFLSIVVRFLYIGRKYKSSLGA
jgi:hypothetical protein